MVLDDPVGVGGVGGGQDLGPGRADGADAVVVDVGGSVHPDPGVAVLVVVPAVEGLAEVAGAWIEPNRPGKLGRYFRVLNWASE